MQTIGCYSVCMENNLQNTILLVNYVVALLATFAGDYRIKAGRKQVRK
jgi:hypothetical protein